MTLNKVRSLEDAILASPLDYVQMFSGSTIVAGLFFALRFYIFQLGNGLFSLFILDTLLLYCMKQWLSSGALKKLFVGPLSEKGHFFYA